MPGRKKEEKSFNENLCIKITKEQKDILTNNKWIADEIRALVRDHINIYVTKPWFIQPYINHIQTLF